MYAVPLGDASAVADSSVMCESGRVSRGAHRRNTFQFLDFYDQDSRGSARLRAAGPRETGVGGFEPARASRASTALHVPRV